MRKAALALVVALPLAGCTSTGAPTELSDLTHVHNLVLHDGEVFVGSHEGVYRQDGDEGWTLIGTEFDAMGLASHGENLIASGHPGSTFDFPGPLGILVSTDGGETWSGQSLVGEVDFHLLETSGDTIMGVAANYGALVKSEDAGVSWTTLEVSALSDLALDPADPQTVVLATEQGLQHSRDGGDSFSLRESAVITDLLHWSETGLFGATADSIWGWDESLGEWVLALEGFTDIRGFGVSGNQVVVLDGTTLTREALSL
jgi:hypothetical protein